MLQQIFTLSFMTAFLAAAVRLAVPLMYGGIGETIAEKSGILNIGMEGVMLSGAFLECLEQLFCSVQLMHYRFVFRLLVFPFLHFCWPFYHMPSL